MLDWAAGSGRHSQFAARLGYSVLALDQNVSPQSADPALPNLVFQKADLETGDWPLSNDKQFDLIVVCNYLFRARLPLLAQHLAPGGFFIYETFAVGNEQYGRPSNPNFLLHPGELLRFCQSQYWHVLAFEDGLTTLPKIARVQRVVAIRLPTVTNGAHDAMKALAL
jgi:SAM-dependent methyltransferase